MRYFLIQKIQELENFYLKYYKYTIQLIIYQKNQNYEQDRMD